MIQKIITDMGFLRRNSEDIYFDGPGALSEVARISQDLVDTAFFHQDRCIGLAANQIGELRNIVLIRNIHNKEVFTYTIMVNLGIYYRYGGFKSVKETCLSYPYGSRGKVRRAKCIKYQYQDMDGNVHKQGAKGLEARIIQHEYDHTMGRLL